VKKIAFATVKQMFSDIFQRFLNIGALLMWQLVHHHASMCGSI